MDPNPSKCKMCWYVCNVRHDNVNLALCIAAVAPAGNEAPGFGHCIQGDGKEAERQGKRNHLGSSLKLYGTKPEHSIYTHAHNGTWM